MSKVNNSGKINVTTTHVFVALGHMSPNDYHNTGS